MNKAGVNVLSVASGFFHSVLPLQTPRQYLDLYNARRGRHYSRFHGYAYDGIWVIALAIDAILQQAGAASADAEDDWALEDLRSHKMHDALNDTDFMGVTVRVDSFFKDASNMASESRKKESFLSQAMVCVFGKQRLRPIISLSELCPLLFPQGGGHRNLAGLKCLHKEA